MVGRFGIGTTFYAPTLGAGKSKKGQMMHAYYVLNNIEYKPGLGKPNDVPYVHLVVSINSIKSGMTYNNPCILNPGVNVHRFITKPSMPNYRRMEAITDKEISRRLKDEGWQLHPSKAPLGMIRRIQKGIPKSIQTQETMREIYQILREQYPHLLGIGS